MFVVVMSVHNVLIVLIVVLIAVPCVVILKIYDVVVLSHIKV